MFKNQLSIQKKNKNYLLDSKSFNATKIIDDLLKADKNLNNKNIFSNNFKLNVEIKKAIFIQDKIINYIVSSPKWNLVLK